REPGNSKPTASVLAGSSAAHALAAVPVLTDPAANPPSDEGTKLASAPASGPVDDGAKATAPSIQPPQNCETDTCIDAYLWSLYERTPKIDINKVSKRIKVTVKEKDKTRTVTETVMTYVVDDFTWKDQTAAQRAGMSLMDYVIGGMDQGFKLRLYNALRAM